MQTQVTEISQQFWSHFGKHIVFRYGTRLFGDKKLWCYEVADGRTEIKIDISRSFEKQRDCEAALAVFVAACSCPLCGRIRLGADNKGIDHVCIIGLVPNHNGNGYPPQDVEPEME